MSRNFGALVAFIDARHGTPHRWGRDANDCVAFVLGAVEAQTGIPPAADLDWSNRAEGLRLIKRLGGLEAAFDARFVRISPGLAQRGDIAGVAIGDFGVHPMIVDGTTLIGPGDKGNKRLPRAAMVMAWSAEPQA
jgi:hypothetical protein